MAGQGPPPGLRRKDPSQRRRRNADPPVTVIAADGKTYGEPLPDDFEWPEVTVSWWETWRTCALASSFTATDWAFLLDTAVLHADFWLGNRSVAGELRLRAAKFGATPEDRARLRIEIGDPDAPKHPTRLKAKTEQGRRARLLKAVGDSGVE